MWYIFLIPGFKNLGQYEKFDKDSRSKLCLNVSILHGIALEVHRRTRVVKIFVISYFFNFRKYGMKISLDLRSDIQVLREEAPNQSKVSTHTHTMHK
jgi:hypothetical protein